MLSFLLVAACGDDTAAISDPVPVVAVDGRTVVAVVIPADASPGLQLAANDLLDAMAAITNTSRGTLRQGSPGDDQAVITAVIDASRADLGDQGYAIRAGAVLGDTPGLEVTAATDVGAMYGLYEIAADLGVRYHHPEETFIPSIPDVALPDCDGNKHRLHDLCLNRASWMFIFAGW